MIKKEHKSSTVIIGFIDASKAFDRVNHQKLFSKLRQRGIHNSILRILTYWYTNQSMQIKWGIVMECAKEVYFHQLFLMFI